MSLSTPIPIVDLFAGPGGLGEGFSSANDGESFKILVSAEMDEAAHSTLKLRAFYRNLKRQGAAALNCYYRFCNGETSTPYDDNTLTVWSEAGNEAQQLTLGNEEDNKKLYGIIDQANLSKSKPWLLIGGPPCQAYSLVGRARNRGIEGYKAEADHRHYLYREYLKVIQKYKPAVFVMENVKGILSSKVEGKKIFHSILQDLSDPDRALDQKFDVGYRIYSLALPTVFERGMDPHAINVHDFIIRAEDYGIPQARHRVILIGVREDLEKAPDQLRKHDSKSTVRDATVQASTFTSMQLEAAIAIEAQGLLDAKQVDQLVRDTVAARVQEQGQYALVRLQDKSENGDARRRQAERFAIDGLQLVPVLVRSASAAH